MSGGQAAVAQATAAVFVDRRQAGSAVLVAARYLVTAAHVLKRGDTDTRTKIAVQQVKLMFPHQRPGGRPGTTAAARVDLGPAGAGVDVAVLDLGEDRPGWLPAPVPVWPAARLPGRVQVFGYPLAEGTLQLAEGPLELAEGPLNGVWRQFTVAGPTAADAVQLDWIADAGTLPGHSGGPVIDAAGHALVGILVQGSERGRFDRFVPVTLIAQAWPTLPRPWLMTGAEPGEVRSHFTRGARGQRSAARGGDLFRGRTAAVDRIRGWLAADEPPGHPLVIIGQPGAGKSAVLARAALSIEAEHGEPGLAFDARSATIGDFLTALANLTGVDTPASADEMVTSLAELPGQPSARVVLDALDEAASDGDRRQITEALAELAVLPGLRVVVATRPLTGGSPLTPGGLLAALGVGTHEDHTLVDLDSDTYFDLDGLRQFASALLARDGMSRPGPDRAWTQYRTQSAVRDRLAGVIAERAGRNFLVAAMAADRLSSAREMIDPADRGFERADIESRVGEALSKYLEQLPEEDSRDRVRSLLTALAYARGAGLDDPAWLGFAQALGYSATALDLDILRRSGAADYLLQATATGRGARPVTRLFHQALADELLAGRRQPSDDEGMLLDLLLGQAEQSGWQVRYLREHAAEHAAAAGRLDQLLEDPLYLLHADIARLLPLLPAPPQSPEAGIVAVLQLAGSALAALPPVPRARQLALASAHLGLADLQNAFAARVDDGWLPLWAHNLVPHQSLAGHAGSVRAVALGRLGDRDVIVSGGDDGTVQLWDASGAPRQSLTGHAGSVRAVALGRAGDQDVIVSAGDDGTVRLWDAIGRPAMDPLVGHAGPVRAVAIGRAGEREVIVSGGEDGIRVWDGATGQILEPPRRDPWDFRNFTVGIRRDEDREITDVSHVRAVAIGQAGDRDVIVTIGNEYEVWDAAQQTRIGALDTGYELTAVVIGKVSGMDVIVSTSSNGKVEQWYSHSRGWDRQVGDAAKPLKAVAICQASGRQLIAAGGTDGEIWAWEAAAQRPTGGPIARQATTVNAIAIGWAANREVIVTGGRDGTVRVWDAAPDEHGGNQLPGHISRVETVAAGAISGRDVIVSGGDDGFGVWDAATGNAIGGSLLERRGTEGRSVKAVAIGWSGNRNQNLLIVASHHGDIQVFNKIDGMPIRLNVPRASPTGAAAGTVRPSDAIVTSGHDGAWDWNPGTPPRIFPDAVYVTPVAAGQIGGRYVVVSGHDDGMLWIWGLALTPVASLATHGARITAVATGKVSDRDVIITGRADGSVQVWDPTDAAKRTPEDPPAGHLRPVTAVAAGRAGGRDVIVSGSTDGNVRIWDVATGRLETLEMLDSVTGLAVSVGHLAVASGIAVAVFSVPHSAPACTDA